MQQVNGGLVPRIPPRMFKTMEPKKRKSLMETIVLLGENGLHARTIARIEGVSTSQVYAICAAFGVKLRRYRDGLTNPAMRIIKRAPYLAIKKVDLEGELLKEYE